MLDRNVFPTPVSSSPSALLREELRAGPTSRLALFLLGLACCLALICLYLWQASTISAIEAEITRMENESRDLERESTALMVQLAQWNAPSFIESKILEQGLKAGPQPIYVQVGDSGTLDKSRRPADQGPLWERFTGWMSRVAYAGAARAGRQNVTQPAGLR